MKQLKNGLKGLTWQLVTVIVGLTAFSACSDDFPENIESSAETVLTSIKILNAGVDGSTVLEGTVDEFTKTVSFPRIDPETDFSAIRFEMEGSQGATLDQESYLVPFDEGESQRTLVIKVVNGPRYREYLVNIRLRVPVFGADFENPMIFDFSNSPEGLPIYPTFQSLLTRGSGFDGSRVLIVTRAEGGSHLLDVQDLKDGKIEPIPLNLEGVSGGTYPVNCGALINGHTYIASLSGGQVSPLKIYHWTDPAAAPEVIANINVASIAGAGVRHGDNLSVNLDNNGNGYIFFGDNAATKVLRLKIANYTSVSDPFVFDSQTGVSSFMSYNRIGNSDQYIFTGYDAPVMLANDGGAIAYRLSSTVVPNRGSDARVITFNGERYLILTTAARSGSDATVLYVYNITAGESIAEALEIFDESGADDVYHYSIGGAAVSAPSTQTNWYVTKDSEGNDEKLMLYSASADAGFALVEFGKKQAED
ncbi:DUF4623 domain-containing protein [Parapedobacter sp. 10938]|uniref:DUF4623 domain-containing protein n=1 Tax=Parapedobacter flavus TaxID=3110225 RepID=UPI002DBB76A8|nr:DUF4623 domain-containing protein [Parapedobacter sp. 10938]MEC3880053.1 DUF4623 domain-containing protein [Parapedobacter sp. 10938]